MKATQAQYIKSTPSVKHHDDGFLPIPICASCRFYKIGSHTAFCELDGTRVRGTGRCRLWQRNEGGVR
jgi:hypothetical protein